MREIITKAESKIIFKKYKKDSQCCLVKLNGKKLPTRVMYYEKLRKKLQLNESFANNYNAYSDMMRDGYTYYNKDIIIFVIKHYQQFLCEDHSKTIIEQIFDQDIIPFFENDISESVQEGRKKEIHVYCVE